MGMLPRLIFSIYGTFMTGFVEMGAITASPDNGCLLTGRQRSSSNLPWETFSLIANSNGDLVANHSFAFHPAIAPMTTDGLHLKCGSGYALTGWAGTEDSYFGHPFLMMLNENGEIQPANFNTPDSTFQFITTCEGSPFIFENDTLIASGIYPIVFQNQQGCDSVVIIELEVLPSYADTTFANICEGETYEWNGLTLSQSGTSEVSFLSLNGCDSIETLVLTVLENSTFKMQATICVGQPCPLSGTIYDNEGNYSEVVVLQNHLSCDSVITVKLTVVPNVFISWQMDICEGDSIEWNGTVYTQPGEYEQNFATVHGCDSTVTLHLSILPSDTSFLMFDLCQGEQSPLTGEVYNDEGVFIEEVISQNQFGCDDLILAELTVHPEEIIYAEHFVDYGYVLDGDTLTQDTSTIVYGFTEFGCPQTVFIYWAVGPNAVADFGSLVKVDVFPNPVSDVFFVELDLPEALELWVEISDATGRKVVFNAEKTFYQKGKHLMEVNANDWSIGIYNIGIHSDQGIATKILIKQ